MTKETKNEINAIIASRWRMEAKLEDLIKRLNEEMLTDKISRILHLSQTQYNSMVKSDVSLSEKRLYKKTMQAVFNILDPNGDYSDMAYILRKKRKLEP